MKTSSASGPPFKETKGRREDEVVIPLKVGGARNLHHHLDVCGPLGDLRRIRKMDQGLDSHNLELQKPGRKKRSVCELVSVVFGSDS